MLPGAESIHEFDIDHFGALFAPHVDHALGREFSVSVFMCCHTNLIGLWVFS